MDEIERPRPGGRIEESGCRRVRGLRVKSTRQPVAHEVGYEQKDVRRLELSRSLGSRQLVDRVDRQELGAADRVQEISRGGGIDPLDPQSRSAVAIVVWVAEEPTRGIDETVVHTPSVDPDARDRRCQPGDSSQAFENLLVEPQDVPVQPIGEGDRFVRESMSLLELEYARADATDHHAPRRGAEIDRGDSTGHHGAAAEPEPWNPLNRDVRRLLAALTHPTRPAARPLAPRRLAPRIRSGRKPPSVRGPDPSPPARRAGEDVRRTRTHPSAPRSPRERRRNPVQPRVLDCPPGAP